MHLRLLALAALFLRPVSAGAATFDVAPTTLDLRPSTPGLFYVSNRGDQPVTVQLEPMDWRQDAGADARTPSKTLLVSPQFATIAPKARQSVRVMAKADGPGEQAYRLLVSELPQPGDAGMGVHVLLQFSVPVFVGHDSKARPQLSFTTSQQDGAAILQARNIGSQTIKLAGISVDGTPQPAGNFFYILPGATHAFKGVATRGTVTTHDQRSDTDIRADIAPN